MCMDGVIVTELYCKRFLEPDCTTSVPPSVTGDNVSNHGSFQRVSSDVQAFNRSGSQKLDTDMQSFQPKRILFCIDPTYFITHLCLGSRRLSKIYFQTCCCLHGTEMSIAIYLFPGAWRCIMISQSLKWREMLRRFDFPHLLAACV